jgi:hypothetical protein
VRLNYSCRSERHSAIGHSAPIVVVHSTSAVPSERTFAPRASTAMKGRFRPVRFPAGDPAKQTPLRGPKAVAHGAEAVQIERAAVQDHHQRIAQAEASLPGTALWSSMHASTSRDARRYLLVEAVDKAMLVRAGTGPEGLSPSTGISSASVPSSAIVSAMNWSSGIASSASRLFIRSVRTQGGAISSTRTPASFSRNRCDGADE